jgi:hypothetical protein
MSVSMICSILFNARSAWCSEVPRWCSVPKFPDVPPVPHGGMKIIYPRLVDEPDVPDQRQYEPILYGWKEDTDHYWCGASERPRVKVFLAVPRCRGLRTCEINPSSGQYSTLAEMVDVMLNLGC